MNVCKISREERQEFIEYMLCNQSLEKSLRNWKRHKRCVESIMGMLDTLAGRAQDNGGMIVAVKCDQIQTGVEHVDFFMPDKKYEIHWVENKNGQLFAMVFTSKERFRECNDTSGVVMFMDELFAMIEKRKDLDGIIINLEKEEIILDKVMLRAVIWLIKKGKSLNHLA